MTLVKISLSYVFKEALKKDECIVHADYSKSYKKNKQHDEIQSAYFRHATFSIFTAWGYFRISDSIKLTKVRMIIVNRANDHSCNTVHKCI